MVTSHRARTREGSQTPLLDRDEPGGIAQLGKGFEIGAGEPGLRAGRQDRLEQGPPAGPVECNRPEQFGPIQLSPEQYARRHGAGVTDLSALKSSKEQPVEVCHVEGEREFLLAARCADGTPPFTSGIAVAKARSGSVGSGGRCRTIIDHYRVPCPEATYEVHAQTVQPRDAYRYLPRAKASVSRV